MKLPAEGFGYGRTIGAHGYGFGSLVGVTITIAVATADALVSIIGGLRAHAVIIRCNSLITQAYEWVSPYER